MIHKLSNCIAYDRNGGILAKLSKYKNENSLLIAACNVDSKRPISLAILKLQSIFVYSIANQKNTK